MAYTKENIKKVRQIFNQKRSAALARSRERLEKLHNEYPDIRSIDSALALTGMKLVEEISKGSVGITERVAAVRSENEKLQEDRAAMLEFYGYPRDYTDVVYECQSCQDTGYVGENMCSCMKKALSLIGIESAGIANLVKTQSFETFDLAYYSGEDRKLAERNLEFCKAYSAKFSKESESLLFFGATGLGKTHMTTAVAKTVIEKGYDVFYNSAPNIFASLEAEKFGREVLFPSSALFDCDLLIIDDLGTENPSALNVNFIYNIINTRLVGKKPTIINTNLSIEEIQRRYTDRIASRMLGEYSILRFTGRDIRMQKVRF